MTTSTTAAVTLARIRLNPLDRAVQRDLADVTQLHRTLMRLVPDNLGDQARHQSGLLFRLEETARACVLLAQVSGPLHPDRLPEGYGHIDVKDLTPMFRALRDGLRVRYRIVANPAKRERLPLEDKGKRGRVVPLVGRDADQWWNRRAAEAGLRVHTLLPSPIRPATQGRRGEKRLRHDLTQFDGTATITDTQALTAAVLTGIGRGKPYGAGLLTLAPASTT